MDPRDRSEFASANNMPIDEAALSAYLRGRLPWFSGGL